MYVKSDSDLQIVSNQPLLLYWQYKNSVTDSTQKAARCILLGNPGQHTIHRHLLPHLSVNADVLICTDPSLTYFYMKLVSSIHIMDESICQSSLRTLASMVSSCNTVVVIIDCGSRKEFTS